MPTAVVSGLLPNPLRHQPLRQLVVGVACLAALQGSLWAQAAAPAVPGAQSTVAAPSSPQWRELTGQQQQSLGPLAGAWDSMGAGQKRKWIALAQNYPTMAPAEQQKLHGRMAEWAALKPKERDLARRNFAETKKISPSERAATWEAYQALSPEEKKKLAERATTRKPVGAAVAIKPVPTSKLAQVPVTRHTPESERAQATAKQAIDRNTLLPQTQHALPAAADALVPTSATSSD